MTEQPEQRGPIRRIVRLLASLLILLSPFHVSYVFVAESSSDQPTLASWSISTVDFSGGFLPSIALDSVGRPHIAYIGGSNDLKYASWTGFSWQFEKVDNLTVFSYKVSLDIGPDDTPQIAYYDSTPKVLKYAHKENGTWNIEIVDSYRDVGRQPSLAVDSRNQPHISYYNITVPSGLSCTLKYAMKEKGSWRLETVADAGTYDGPKYETSIALNQLDQPRIAFSDHDYLSYAYWNGSQWRVEKPPPAGPTDSGDSPSLALDSNDTPHISSRSTFMYDELDYSTRGPTGWVNSIVDPGKGARSSIAIDSQDMPHIAYITGFTGIFPPAYLYYAHLDGTWIYEIADMQEYVGWPVSLALDGCDGSHVAYRRNYTTGTELRYAHQAGTDVSPPKSSVSPPGEYWVNTSPTQISAKVIDTCSGAASATLWYRHSTDNASWGAWSQYSLLTSPPWTWSFSFPDGEGYYEFYTTSQDKLGHVELPPTSADAIAGYDATPPVSTALPIHPYWHVSPPLAVNATASDALSGVGNLALFYSHSPDNISWSPWTQHDTIPLPPWSWTFTFPDGEGHYRFHTIARDVAGNVEGGKSTYEAMAGYEIPYPDLTITSLDVIPPSPLLDLTVAQLNATVANLGTLSASAFDILFFDDINSNGLPDAGESVASRSLSGLSGQSHIEVSVPWTASPPGAHSLCAYADPPPGNVSESNETNNAACIDISVQPGPPKRPDYAPTTPQPLSPIKVGLSLPVSLSIQVSNNGNATAADDATVAFYQQPSSPFLTFTLTPLAPNTTSTRFTATWISPAISGTYQVHADVDYDGNVTEWDETNNVYTWTIEVVPGPVTSLVLGSPNYTSTATYVTSSTPLSLSVIDQVGSGINYTKYRIDNVTWYDYTGTPFFLAGEGTHTVEYYSRDLLTNEETIQSIQIVVDNAPPASSLSIGAPKHLVGGNFVNSSTPLTLHADDGGLIPVGTNDTFYRLWNGTWSPWREYASSFTLIGRDGAWFVEFLSFDFLGNREGVQNVTLVLDNTPPSLSIDPEETTVLVDTHFSISADDAQGSGVASVEYRTDGEEWTPYSSPFALGVGHHLIDYRSSDNLNNSVERSLPVNVVAPETPPEGRVEVNYKPLIALLFSILIAVAAAYSSKRRPLSVVKDRKRKTLFSWAILGIPFVGAEVATGILSLYFEPLRIPPVVGWGTGVDVSILVAGIVFLLLRLARRKGTKPKPQGYNPDTQSR